jgi:hypothetical protein
VTGRARARFLSLATLLALSSIAAASHAADTAPAAPPAKATAEGDSSDPAVAKAREHFGRAQQLYDEGHFEAALLELQRAYEVKPSWRLLFNLAELRFTVHDYVGSLRTFERFLAEGGTEIDAPKRAAAESKLGTLRSLVGSVKIATNVAGATIYVDDEAIGKSPLPPAMVSAGRHKISATRDGYRPATGSVAVLGSEETSAELTLMPESPDRAAAGDDSPSRWTTLSWVGVGTSAAFAVGSVAMFAAGSSASTELTKITYVGATPSQEYRDKESEVSRDRVLGITFAAASAVTLGLTLYLTLTRNPAPASRPSPASPAAPASASLAFALSSRGVFLDGRFP